MFTRDYLDGFTAFWIIATGLPTWASHSGRACRRKGLSMFARVAFAVAMFVAVIAGRPVAATPVTYDFTGNFDRPMNGSTQFSGSVTFDGSPAITHPGGFGVIPDP